MIFSSLMILPLYIRSSPILEAYKISKIKPKSLTEVFHLENMLKNINTAFTLQQQPSSEA
jgi:hypothetical protein